MRRLALLIALTFCGCVPRAKAPTPIEAATAAVNLTDEAMAIAMNALPPQTPAQLVVWEDRVRWLEDAAAAVRTAKNSCSALARVITVADAIACKPCAAAVESARKGLACPTS